MCACFIGRLHDYHVLDMVELGVVNFKSSRMCRGEPCVLGSKPCMLFSGDMFETDSKYVRLKNLFIGELLTRGGQSVDHLVWVGH